MQDRVALVTGAGRGIGRAAALALAADGLRVALAARTPAELAAVQTTIEEAGGQAITVVDDLADRSAPRRMVGKVSDQWGGIDVLVNNAGIGSSQAPQAIVDFEDDFWDLSFAVNVTAPFRLTKLVLPAMLQKGWGRVINIASINAQTPALHAAAYVSTKHALAGFTKATAMEVASSGITANAVCPGVTATRLNDKRIEYDAQRLGKTAAELEAQASPLGRRLTPEEVASVVAFLARDEANAVNGQLINVCGGRLMA